MGYFNPEKYTIVASKDGFQTQTSVIDWHVSGWYWAGNFVIGGLIGYLIIDPITGDMYYLDEEVNLNMSPVQNKKEGGRNTDFTLKLFYVKLYIVTTKKIQPNMLNYLKKY